MRPPNGSDVYVSYLAAKVVRGVRKRVRKKFPGGWTRTGLARTVKDFYLAMCREGRKPTVLDADGRTPLYGPESKAARMARAERTAHERAEALAEQRCAAAGALFDNTPDQLPD